MADDHLALAEHRWLKSALLVFSQSHPVHAANVVAYLGSLNASDARPLFYSSFDSFPSTSNETDDRDYWNTIGMNRKPNAFALPVNTTRHHAWLLYAVSFW